MSERYETFVNRLQESRKAVFRVAEWFHRGDATMKGRGVFVPAMEICPPDGNFKDYADNGDLYVQDDKRGLLKYEVKHRAKLKFETRNDYPFPDVFVSNQGTVDRNEGEIAAYIIVNDTMTNALIIPWKTKDKWVLRDVFASNTQRVERYYVCPLEEVTFRKISE